MLGTIALSVLFGVVILVTLLILGVPFALLIGLWVALVAMIPLVGGLIAAVPSVLIALLHSPTAGVVMAIVFVGFQLVENHFIYPVVMSRSVRMNPLWVLLVGAGRGQPGWRVRVDARGPDRGAGGHPGGRGHPGDLPGELGTRPGRPARRSRSTRSGRPTRWPAGRRGRDRSVSGPGPADGRPVRAESRSPKLPP